MVCVFIVIEEYLNTNFWHVGYWTRIASVGSSFPFTYVFSSSSNEIYWSLDIEQDIIHFLRQKGTKKHIDAIISIHWEYLFAKELRI